VPFEFGRVRWLRHPGQPLDSGRGRTVIGASSLEPGRGRQDSEKMEDPEGETAIVARHGGALPRTYGRGKRFMGIPRIARQIA